MALRNIPGIVISNVSFPKIIEKKIIENNGPCELILPYLLNSIRQLEKTSVDFIVLPCNTLHNLLPKLRKQTNLKILDLVEETVKEIKKRKLKKIAILATTKTKTSKLYDKFLNNIEILYPDKKEQKSFRNNHKNSF